MARVLNQPSYRIAAEVAAGLIAAMNSTEDVLTLLTERQDS
ncbi:hypothetical protein [Streptomyces sp. NPDC016845]